MDIHFGRMRRAQTVRLLQGFSLVELMVAMTLSLMLIGGAFYVFLGTRSTYESIDQLSRIQENGRFALEQIVHDIRSAGYAGCAKAVKGRGNSLTDSTTLLWNLANPIQGFEGTGTNAWAPALDSSIPATAISGTANTLNDILVVRIPKRGAIPARLAVSMKHGTDNLTITTSTPASIEINDVMMVSDCEAQAFLEVTGYSVASGVGTISHAISNATTSSPGNASGNIAHAFPANAEVIPVVTNIYFLAPSTAGTSTSLWRKSGKSSAEELIEGVDGMRLLFGVDTDDDQQVDQYVKASKVTNWDLVVSVRVALLIRALDQYGNMVNKKIYALLDTNTSSFSDRRQRQVFSSTVTLRNKAL
jgi:type IV pilus assembly protein PilW